MNVRPTRSKIILSLAGAAVTEIAIVLSVFITRYPKCDPNDLTILGIAPCGYGFDATDVLLKAGSGGLYYALMVLLAVYLVYSLFERK